MTGRTGGPRTGRRVGEPAQNAIRVRTGGVGGEEVGRGRGKGGAVPARGGGWELGFKGGGWGGKGCTVERGVGRKT